VAAWAGFTLRSFMAPGAFNKLHVVKRLREDLAEDPACLEMFLAEARLAARIDHPNVVHTTEVGFDGTHYFIAMEYLDGQTLHEILRRAEENNCAIPLALHLRIITEALAGLHFAHELRDYDNTPLGVVHRDISPHNVFVTYAGIPETRRTEVEQEMANLRVRVALVDVKTNVNDVVNGNAPLSHPLILNPGRRRIAAVKSGYLPNTQVVSVVGSDTLSVRFDLQLLASPTLAPVTTVAPAPAAPPPIGPLLVAWAQRASLL